MDADLLRTLTVATLASSLAVLLIGLLRKPLRAAVGARAAYWLWLLVPALVLASVLPVPTPVLYFTSVSLPEQVRSALSTAIPATLPGGSGLVAAVITAWAMGASAMFVLLLRRQRAFTRALAPLRADPDGIHRSAAAAAPMLVGAWNPRIVVPLDFEARYSREEQDLVLIHERAHLSRRDAVANAVASAWLCLFWFNPLIYWAMGWLRTDQELACDARVLAQRADARRCYANALLKTQLATESAWRMPVGCHWQSSHSLKERIVMLKRPLPGITRQLIGIASVIALTGSGGYAAWAAQATVDSKGPPVLVKMKVTAETLSEKSKDTFSATTLYLVHSGETPPPMNAKPYDFACTAFLPGGKGTKRAELPAPIEGQILLDCTVSLDGKVVHTPAIIAFDGHEASIEIDDRVGLRKYKIELKATTSDERIAAALETVHKR